MHYLTIENGVLSKNNLLTERINIKDIKQVKNSFGNYTLITGSTELKINTKLIEEDSLLKLSTLLEGLKLAPQ